MSARRPETQSETSVSPLSIDRPQFVAGDPARSTVTVVAAVTDPMIAETRAVPSRSRYHAARGHGRLRGIARFPFPRNAVHHLRRDRSRRTELDRSPTSSTTLDGTTSTATTDAPGPLISPSSHAATPSTHASERPYDDLNAAAV